MSRWGTMSCKNWKASSETTEKPALRDANPLVKDWHFYVARRLASGFEHLDHLFPPGRPRLCDNSACLRCRRTGTHPRPTLGRLLVSIDCGVASSVPTGPRRRYSFWMAFSTLFT